ncbi:MAG: hypothetical protein ACLUD1_10115 [Clostridia bacterium]
MSFILLIASFAIFFYSVFYAIYEIKKKDNLLGGIFIIVLSCLTVFLPSILFPIR